MDRKLSYIRQIEEFDFESESQESVCDSRMEVSISRESPPSIDRTRSRPTSSTSAFLNQMRPMQTNVLDETILAGSQNFLDINNGNNSIFRRSVPDQISIDAYPVPQPRTPVSRQPILPEIFATLANLPDPPPEQDTTLWDDSHYVPEVPSSGILLNRQIPREQQEFNRILESGKLENVTPEMIDKLSDAQLASFFYNIPWISPRERLRTSYPFLAEGVVHAEGLCSQLIPVYSARMGKIYIKNSSKRGSNNYVFFLVFGEGVYRALSFSIIPPPLLSLKSPKENQLHIRGYGIMTHAVEREHRDVPENHWIVWNDQLGLMRVASGAARTALKKNTDWDKQLDLVIFHAEYTNKKFRCHKIEAVTYEQFKRERFPQEPFLVTDLVLTDPSNDEDHFFYSMSLDLSAQLSKRLIGAELIEPNRRYEMVVVPQFPRSQFLEFRVILPLIGVNWSSGKEWIRDILKERTEIYLNDAMLHHNHK